MIYVALGVVLALVVAWNVIPQFRDRLRGWSTILEGALGTVLVYADVLGGALEEAQNSGYVPDNWQTFVPALILGWIVLKRFQTSTPVGSDDT